MAEQTNITWADATWNIARGCTKVDEDCKFCYMYRESMDSKRYDPLDVVRTKTVFDMPLKYKETKSKVWDGNPLIFTCSLTDFFHEAIDGYRNEAWDIIRKCPHLTFQILTKRPERIPYCLPEDWGAGWDNVWFGTSIGSAKGIKRAYQLILAMIKSHSYNKTFLSLEPMYEELDLYKPVMVGDQLIGKLIDTFNWIIVGGESGNETGKYRYRECKIEWIEKIVQQCKESDTPAFVKQLGTHLAKAMKLHSRHGSDVEDFPEHLRLREFPKTTQNG